MDFPTTGYTPGGAEYLVTLEGPEDQGAEYVQLRTTRVEGANALDAVEVGIQAMLAHLRAVHPTWVRRVSIDRTVTGTVIGTVDVP